MTKLALLLCFILASLHFSMQLGLISDFCAVPQNIKSIEQFSKLFETPVTCSKIAWKFLGVPMSVYNAIFSGILFLFLVFQKQKQPGTVTKIEKISNYLNNKQIENFNE